LLGWREYGYKAASAKKEEDMRKAFQAGVAYDNYLWGISNRLGYEYKPNEELFIQSLNPLPKQVEIQMEELYEVYSSFDGWTSETKGVYDKTTDKDRRIITKPKVDANNFVQVVKWIYEVEN